MGSHFAPVTLHNRGLRIIGKDGQHAGERSAARGREVQRYEADHKNDGLPYGGKDRLKPIAQGRFKAILSVGARCGE